MRRRKRGRGRGRGGCKSVRCNETRERTCSEEETSDTFAGEKEAEKDKKGIERTQRREATIRCVKSRL